MENNEGHLSDEKILIKNGMVLLFKENDVVLEKKDLLIENGKIKKIEENILIRNSNVEKAENNNVNDESYGSINGNAIQDNIKIINAINRIVMPGLINTHAHIPMSIFRETTEGCKLYDWLSQKIWPIEEKLTEEDIYYASMLSFIEMVSTGTTCINDQYFLQNAIRKAANDIGVRAVLTRTIIGDKKEAEEKEKEFINFYESREKENDLITYTVAPHSLYTCSPEALEITENLAKKFNLPVHVHFLESIDEIEDIKNKHGEEAIYVLKKYFSEVHTILAHCVKLDDKDIEILKQLDCGIAHNPVSNLRLGCKIADTTKYIKEGLNVALRNRWTGVWK